VTRSADTGRNQNLSRNESRASPVSQPLSSDSRADTTPNGLATRWPLRKFDPVSPSSQRSQRGDITSSNRASPASSVKGAFSADVMVEPVATGDPARCQQDSKELSVKSDASEESHDAPQSHDSGSPRPSNKTSWVAPTSETVPTYLPQKLLDQLPHQLRQAAHEDANTVDVNRPRHWCKIRADNGKFADAIVPALTPSDSGWAQDAQPPRSEQQKEKDALLQQWVTSVPPASPPISESAIRISESALQANATSLTSVTGQRPDSTARILLPATVFYSGDEKDSALSTIDRATPTEHLTANYGKDSPQASRPDAQRPRRPPPVVSVSIDGSNSGTGQRGRFGPGVKPLRSPVTSLFGYTGRRGRPRYREPGSDGQWWKRQPHPLYSPLWAGKRLLVL